MEDIMLEGTGESIKQIALKYAIENSKLNYDFSNIVIYDMETGKCLN